MEEGLGGRVLMMQEIRSAAREMPDHHEKILRDLRLFGQAIPDGSLFSKLVH